MTNYQIFAIFKDTTAVFGDLNQTLITFFLCAFAPLRETKTVVHLPANSL
ncbi:MAG: hypothetical protein ACKPFD_21860 [Dolichospermum sp.]